MPRRHTPWWSKRDRCYYTRLDGLQMPLRREDGGKVEEGDERGMAEALGRLLAARDEAARRGHNPTVAEVCSAYLVAMARELDHDSVYGKEWILKQFCAFGGPPYGDRPARGIDSTHLHAMRKAWERKYAGGTVRRLYRDVLACWSWASRPEPEREPVVLLAKNPLEKLRLPAGSPKKDRYVPIGTLRRLVAFTEARAETMGPLRSRFESQTTLMLRLLIETGCRPKEACESTWKDFDPERGLIVLPPGRHKVGKKTGRPRVIVLPNEIRVELIALRDSGYAHPVHLFAHARGKGEASKRASRETGIPWKRPSLSEWFTNRIREARAAGMALPEGFSLYWLRVSFLTDAIQAGLTSDAAADLAGNTREIAREHYHQAQANYLRMLQGRVTESRARVTDDDEDDQ